MRLNPEKLLGMSFSPMKRQFKLLAAIKIYSDSASKALARNVPLKSISSLPIRTELTRAKFESNMDEILDDVIGRIEIEMDKLEVNQ